MDNKYDLIIVGGGPGGIASAVEAAILEMPKVLLLEKGDNHSTTIRKFYKDDKRVDKDYKGEALDLKGNIKFETATKGDVLDLFSECLFGNYIEAMFNRSIELSTKRYSKIKKIAENLVSMYPDKGTILTQCFGESIVGFMIQEFQKKNKDIKVVCAETRPYFQGARLTATVAYDQGADVTVITDNMAAYTMQEKKIDVFTSAADLICLNGAVVNKIGTFQIAIVAKYLGIPYFVTGAPDKGYHGLEDVHFEFRDEKLVTEAMGVKTSKEGVKGFYPAFDYTPPHLVSAVVTDLGIYSPYDVFKYYVGNDEGEY